ncbi:unnamed protein product [Paramecium octaurelia]|uniref:aspartate transaminase n=1 Tax=Paramecium octaurelia TaxID=43137 RepID=A0A8S1UU04_PAROT|nr:unnamed protein product [Paramecium octaurelia]
MIVAYSFSKNMGLYNKRVGGLHIVTSSQEIATKPLSNLKIVIRTFILVLLLLEGELQVEFGFMRSITRNVLKN